MPATATDKPVFIDQMPEHQVAVRQLLELSRQPQAFEGVANELGLSGELKQASSQIGAMAAGHQSLAQSYEATRADLKAQKAHNTELAREIVLGGGTATLAAGVATAAAVAKRTTTIKGILAGAGAGLAAVVAWVASFRNIIREPQEKIDTLREQAFQLRLKGKALEHGALATQQQLLSDMATQMLDDRKTLVGTGADMKLVPENQTMAGKYATAPAASKADGIMLSAQTVTVQAGR